MLILQVQPTMILQDCIDSLNNYGGGTLNLSPTAVYYPKGDLNIYSGITIEGNNSTIDFEGEPYGIKIIGTLNNEVISPNLKNLTVINSSTTGIQVDYAINEILNILDNVIVKNCDVGVSISNSFGSGIIGTFQDNGVNFKLDSCDGFEFHYCSIYNSLSGDGLILTNCNASTIFDTGIDNNFGSGIKMTNCSAIACLDNEYNENGIDGIRLVSGNIGIKINLGESNTNSGYGFNIMDNTNTSTILTSITTTGNVNGPINDLGTGTLKSNLVNSLL